MNYKWIHKPAMTLSAYADLMGIDPIHFFGGTSASVMNIFSGCASVWFRHTWQSSEQASHEELAMQLLDAERSIAELIGFPITPQYVEIDLPVPDFRNGLHNKYGEYKSITTNIGNVVAGGVEATELIASSLAVVYSDEDSDGFEETGTIDASDPAFADWSDNYGKLVIVPAGGVLQDAIDTYVSFSNDEIVVNTWVMIKPEIASRFPSNDITPVDLEQSANLIQSVDVYRVYNDPTQACTILYSDGTEQQCTLDILDVGAGIVRPVPTTLVACSGQALRYKVSLLAGYVEDSFWINASGDTNRYSPLWEDTVKLLATARLDRDICGCNNVNALAKDLRTDMALVSPQGNFLAVADLIQECPFGTRKGEWLAWNRIRMFGDKYHSVAIV